MPPRGRDPELRLIQSLLELFLSLSPRQRRWVIIILLLAALLIGFIYWQQNRIGSSSGVPFSPHLLLGNPSSATSSIGNPNNYLMLKPYFALSYNNSNGTPTWVSWRVRQADLGSAPRKPAFDFDATLPFGFRVVTHKDYSGSGFDRGHMCPHSDRAANQDSSFATFVMTNIIPQAPNVNRKAWAQLESYCRELVVREHDRLYITSGPAGQGGRGSKGAAQTLAGGKVVVPAECWKIIVVLPDDDSADDLSKINANTRVISVDMPNDQSAVGEEWASFRISPADIERKTGYRFFDRVQPDIAEILRQSIDRKHIPRPKPMFHGDE